MRNNDKIKSLLEPLSGSIIEKIEFNILQKNIFLELKLIENGIESMHTLEFKSVWSHYYTQDTTSSEIDFTETNYLELTSIDYASGGISSVNCKSNLDDWFNSIHSMTNFALEIWEGLLLIEARKIVIDDNEFELQHLN